MHRTCMSEKGERGAEVIVSHGHLLQHASFSPGEHEIIELLVDLGKDETEETRIYITTFLRKLG